MSVCDPSPRTPLRAVGNLPTQPGAKLLSRKAGYARSLSSGVKIEDLATPVREFIEENMRILQPEHLHVCDGSEEENQSIIKKLQDMGRLTKLEKYENW